MAKAKGTRGINRQAVPSTFPFGKTKVDVVTTTDVKGKAGGPGLYGKRVGGTAPINAAKDHSRRSRKRG